MINKFIDGERERERDGGKKKASVGLQPWTKPSNLRFLQHDKEHTLLRSMAAKDAGGLWRRQLQGPKREC